MSILYDKPFKTYQEQIEIIKRKNIIVEDSAYAYNILSTISYHTLINGYKDTLLEQPSSESFINNVNLETLYTIHLLDTNISSFLFKNILYIERSLKTKLSYLISEKYGVSSNFTTTYIDKHTDGYLSLCHYSNNARDKLSTLANLKKTVLESRKAHNIINHYKQSKNHIPPWILVTNLTFGQTIQWYNILKNDDKTNLCNQLLPYTSCTDINEKKELLRTALDLLRCYRNNIAHGNKTFNKNLKHAVAKPAYMKILAPNILTETEYRNDIGRKDLFAILLLIMILIHDKYIISNFYIDLKFILQPYENRKVSEKSIFEIFGLPENLFKRLEDLHEAKIKTTSSVK